MHDVICFFHTPLDAPTLGAILSKLDGFVVDYDDQSGRMVLRRAQ